MNSESVKRNNVTRDFRHGTRGESAGGCIGDIIKGGMDRDAERAPNADGPQNQRDH